MNKQNLREQAVAVEITAETTEQPLGLISRLKEALADITPRQILKLALLGLGLVVWWPIYSRLVPFSLLITYDVFRITRGTHLGDAVSFFFLDIPKVFMLLLLVIFGVGVLRSFFTPERTRTILAGKREILGDVLAALLGVVTPFCSCSAVPLFIGFVEAGIPIGVTFAFLISAPMVNEIALVLLFGLFGWRIALIYMSMGLLIAMLTGWIIGRLNMERQVEDWVYEIRMGPTPAHLQQLSWMDRIDYGLHQVRDIVGRVWVYIILGIGAGAAIHGYVPEGFLAALMGKQAWWSVPAAVILGAPLYSNAAGIIPVVQALLGKGAALGTVLAFMMSIIGISFPETVILRKVLKPKLIAVFVGVVTLGIIIVGFIFNLII
ncbi:MAG: permease [Deltaproteobacteria bacterium]|nr:permease [Deltaproteobacteria bacterium]MBI4794545.1 permease [Deltaproteobacteria bacterium]